MNPVDIEADVKRLEAHLGRGHGNPPVRVPFGKEEEGWVERYVVTPDGKMIFVRPSGKYDG